MLVGDHQRKPEIIIAIARAVVTGQPVVFIVRRRSEESSSPNEAPKRQLRYCHREFVHSYPYTHLAHQRLERDSTAV